MKTTKRLLIVSDGQYLKGVLPFSLTDMKNATDYTWLFPINYVILFFAKRKYGTARFIHYINISGNVSGLF
jgi:hypothetical protein